MNIERILKGYHPSLMIVVVANAITSVSVAEDVRTICNNIGLSCVVEYTRSHLTNIEDAKQYINNKYKSANYFKVVFIDENNEVMVEPYKEFSI